MPYSVAMLAMVPLQCKMFYNKKYLVTAEVFMGGWVGRLRKRHFNVLCDKLGMSVAPNYYQISGHFYFTFTVKTVYSNDILFGMSLMLSTCLFYMSQL